MPLDNNWANGCINQAVKRLFEPLMKGIPAELVDEYEAAAKRGEVPEFAFISNDGGKTYDLRIAGVLNGLLKHQNMTLVGHFTDDHKPKGVGVSIQLGKRFGEPVTAPDGEVHLCSYFCCGREYGLFAKGQPGNAKVFLRKREAIGDRIEWRDTYRVDYWEGGPIVHPIGHIYYGKLGQFLCGAPEQQLRKTIERAIRYTEKRDTAEDNRGLASTNARRLAYQAAQTCLGIIKRHGVVSPETRPSCKAVTFCTTPCCEQPDCEEPWEG